MGDVRRAPLTNRTKTVTATTTLTAEDAGVVFAANTGAITLNLPAAASSTGVWFTVIKTTSAAFAVTIDGNASETINGSTTHATIDAQYDTITIHCNGTAWFISSSIIA